MSHKTYEKMLQDVTIYAYVFLGLNKGQVSDGA